MKRDIKLFGGYLIMLLAISILAGCVTQSPKELLFQNIENGQNSELTEKVFIVINTEPEWEGFCRLLNKNSCEMDLDFEKNTIIVASMGEQNTGGHLIKIKKIVEQGDTIVVYVEEKYPSEGEMVTQVLTYPYDIVSISKTSKSIVFRNN